MLRNDKMETASTAVKSIQYRANIQNMMRRTHRYFVSFGSPIQVEISTLNRCDYFHMDSFCKIDEILSNFPLRNLTSNRWRIDKDVFIGFLLQILFRTNLVHNSEKCFPRHTEIVFLIKFRNFVVTECSSMHLFCLLLPNIILETFSSLKASFTVFSVRE